YNIQDEARFINSLTGFAQLCGPDKYCTGQYVVQDQVAFTHPYMDQAIIFNSSHDVSIWRKTFNFDVTGLYCVAVETNTPSEVISINFEIGLAVEAWYGKLPGADYPKLGLFLGLSITYLIIGAVWTFRSWMFWRDILQLQHFISGVTFFLMVEMAFNYAYFEDYNIAGQPHSFLLIMVVMLNAARNSLSFFMLLIVSLGYGVVKPTLGPNMKKCVVLGIVHFFCGVLYGAGSLIINDISASFALLFSLPLSFAMTTFYYSILYALTSTMKGLEERRQPIKQLMYQRLWRILVFSAIMLLAFFIVNTIAFRNRMDPEWLPVYWQYRWLLLDGWLNILYLIVYLSIALLWRPTDNNQRYGLEQIASDDYFDEDDDDEVEFARNGAAPGLDGANTATKVKQRKVQLRAMHTAHTDETLEDGGVDYEEDDEDVFKWAEENTGDSAAAAAGVVGGSSGLPRDNSTAGLLQESDNDDDENDADEQDKRGRPVGGSRVGSPKRGAKKVD
ncbi:hypothetical protein HK100_001160, partial [Physocladia obscura]